MLLGKVLILCSVLYVVHCKKTPMFVYYESLCPDSKAFITKQLHPTMKILKDHIELHLVPFGKSSYETKDSETSFKCHHGPVECYGNKIHACALNHITTDTSNDDSCEFVTLEYVNCLMKIAKPSLDMESYENFTRQCANDTNVKAFDSIEKCAKSAEGSKCLELMGETTHKFQKPLKSVPTITIGESDHSKVLDLSLTSVICQNLSSPKPDVCGSS